MQSARLTSLTRFGRLEDKAARDLDILITRKLSVQAAGKDIAIISGESYDAFHSLKGYYAPEQWDVYWTGRQVIWSSFIGRPSSNTMVCIAFNY